MGLLLNSVFITIYNWWWESSMYKISNADLNVTLNYRNLNIQQIGNRNPYFQRQSRAKIRWGLSVFGTSSPVVMCDIVLPFSFSKCSDSSKTLTNVILCFKRRFKSISRSVKICIANIILEFMKLISSSYSLISVSSIYFIGNIIINLWTILLNCQGNRWP